METAHEYRIIDRITLKSKMDKKEKFHLWNVLGPEYYKPENNIPGSRHVPVDQIDRVLPDLNIGKNEEIITYCAGFQCQASKKAADKLIEKGYTNVSAYEGGIEDWKKGETSQSSGSCCG